LEVKWVALGEVVGGGTSVEVVMAEGMEGERERMIMVERKKNREQSSFFFILEPKFSSKAMKSTSIYRGGKETFGHH
jgi:hypothetical protein